MAKNNWANEAFRRAQNLMSRGYNDFEPTTVVTKDQLSDLGDAITTSRPRTEGPRTDRQLDTNMRSPFSGNVWNLDNEVETHPVEEDTPIEGYAFDVNTVEADAKALEEKNAIRNRDPNRPQSEWDKFAAPDELTEDEYTKKQTYMAIQMIEKELKETRYNSFTKMTPGEKEERDRRILELETEQKRLMDKYRARDWTKDSVNEKARTTYKDAEQKVIDKMPEAKELGNAFWEGIKEFGRETWEEHKDKLDPNFQAMVEDGIGYIKDKTKGVKEVKWSEHNNPGNIESTNIKWDGERPGKFYGKNDRFASFETPEAGISAMTKDLTTKLKRHNGDLKAMISEYAPKADGNDIKKYMKVVKKTAGDKYRYTEEDIQNIVKGFIRMENKKELADYYINIMEK